MKRRDVLKLLAASTASAPLSSTMAMESFSPKRTQNSVFRHGVASGDPLADSVILWTRVTLDEPHAKPVTWEVASDQSFSHIVDYGSQVPKAENDFTIKLDIKNLQPGQYYFYRFSCAGEQSPIGRTKTLGRGHLESAKLAVVSCSNYPAGYFHVYREIAKNQELDAVIHLGDYIYEYGAKGYATEHAQSLQRVPNPAHEIETLADYRLRHGQYKTDTDLQALHANHPMIAVWDDHEIANNAWTDGSEHPGSLDWNTRKAAALQAYYEWMPIRENREVGINRRFDFGNLASLIMLDTRLKGREPQLSTREYMQGQGLDRHMLGDWQFNWLKEQLNKTQGQRWNLIGQQVMVSPLHLPDLRGIADPKGDSVFNRGRGADFYQKVVAASPMGLPLLLDAWDGYPKAREAFLQLLHKHASNPLVLTGDIHTGICSDLYLNDKKTKVGMELITSSVTSPGLDDYFPTVEPRQAGPAFISKNPHIRYAEGTYKGWLQLELNHREMKAQWMYVSSVLQPDYSVFQGFEVSQDAS